MNQKSVVLSAAFGFLGFSGVALAVDAPAHLNLQSSFADTKTILANGGQADIVVLGDSLSFNPGNYLPVFRNLMQNQYGNAGAGYQGFNLFAGVGMNNGWMRTGINTDNVPYHGMDGLWDRYDGVTGFPNSADAPVADKNVQIHYYKQPGGGEFILYRPTEPHEVGTFSTSGSSPSVATLNHTLLPGETGYSILPRANGQVKILGHNSTRPDPGVRVHRAANGGWGVRNFNQRDFTFDEQLDLLSTDMIMVWLGQNDQIFDRTSYATQINGLVTRLQTASPDAEIVLIGTYNQGSPFLGPLIEGMGDVAASRGVGFINLYDTGGDTAFLQANGYIADGVHFSPAGGQYFGNLLFNAFQTNGASLVPEPATIGVLAMAGMTLAARRRR